MTAAGSPSNSYSGLDFGKAFPAKPGKGFRGFGRGRPVCFRRSNLGRLSLWRGSDFGRLSISGLLDFERRHFGEGQKNGSSWSVSYWPNLARL